MVVKEIKVSALRKLLGIKKLRKKIPISESEKGMILGLREREKHRIVRGQY